jgi:NDP-sugar pyrophosphorylase family protein
LIALVLAAGYGTRFRPATLTTPKPLLPFLGRPILFHLFDHLIAEGIEGLVVNTHHLAEVLESAVGRSYRGVPVSFSREPEILGTAGAIRRAAEAGLLPDERFFIVNGDLFTDIPLKPLSEAAADSGTLSAMAVLPNPAPERETPLWGDRDALSGVGGTPGDGATGPWLFTGLQCATRALLDLVPPGRSELARDVLAPSIARGERAFRLVPCGEGRRWFDLGTPERMALAEDQVRRGVTGDSTPFGPSPTRRSGSGPTKG